MFKRFLLWLASPTETRPEDVIRNTLILSELI
jgi:hypothetical protein